MAQSIRVPWEGWKIVQVIGRGGFGTVYLIEKDIFGTKERAALKVLNIPETHDEIDELYEQGYDQESISAHFKGQLEDIISEYSIMTQLKSHPNIVYCEEVRQIQHEDEIGWDVYIKMELLTPLNKAVSNKYNEDEVVRLGKDLCNALIFCGKKSIIHRDIKPQNIFVSEGGSYKLGDFGVAKVTDKTQSGTKIGTYEYMAPEVYKVQPYGPRADIYSLGLVLYWMMNQKCTPFLPLPPQIPSSQQKESARNRRLDGEQLPPPVNGSKELKAIVLKACAFNPRDRYASAQEMLNALQNMTAPIPQPPVKPQPTPKPVNLDVRKEMTFEHTNHPAGKYLSTQVDAKEVHFSVPMNIEDGQTIHLPGKGKYDNHTGASGDLYITIHIKPAPPQPTRSNNRTLYLVIAALAAILAIVLCIPRNKTTTEPGTTPTVPQKPTTSTQNKTTDTTSPPATTEPKTTQHQHSWEDATYNSPRKCSSCGATEGSKKSPSSPVGLHSMISSSRASSTYSGDTQSHRSENLYDGDLGSNWTEGASGNGIGESVTLYFDSIFAVKEFEINIGSHSEWYYSKNCRPKILTLTFSDGSTEQIQLKDTHNLQIFTFSKYYYTDSVKITITEVYSGSNYSDTIIAELNFVAYYP